MATQRIWSGPWRSEPQVSVKRKRIDLITISDDEFEDDQNHTSRSSQEPQDQTPNLMAATSSTTTNTPTIVTAMSSTRESVIRKLIETIHISDLDDEVDSDYSHTTKSLQGSQTRGHSSRSHQIPSSLTSRKILKSNLDTKILCGNDTAEKQYCQLLNLKNVPHTHQTPPSATAQAKKILKSKLELQHKINQKNISMIPGFSVPVNAALNKVKLESDYIPVKSETTVKMDQPPLPVSLPPPPPLPQVVCSESPPLEDFPLLPPPPQWTDDPPPTLSMGTHPASNSRMGSRVQAEEVAAASRPQPLQSASSSRNVKPFKSVRVKDGEKVQSWKQKGRRIHKMRLRHTTLENGALQQKQSPIPDSEDEDESSAVSISNSNHSKNVGGNLEKGQRRDGTIQQRPRLRKQHDKNLTRVKPAEGSLCYVCKFCGKAFPDHWHGTRHVRSHTGDKPFKCSFCHKGFSVNYELTEHESTHMGIKVWKCKFCSRTFRNHSSLSHHFHICVKKTEKNFALQMNEI